MKHIRGSEVSSFLRCRKQWKYSWIDNLEPKRPDNKLFFGNLAHKFLEVYYSNFNGNFVNEAWPQIEAYNAMEKLFQETDTSGMQQTELDELWELATGVMENYVKQWAQADEGITVLATELRFAIPLDDETVYEGTIDMVYLDRDGRLFFKDYKNVASIERYVDMAEMDRQISRYWWALEQLARGNGYLWSNPCERWEDIHTFGIYEELKEPSGFFYDLILKAVPKIPKLLKPTKKDPIALSKAKDQVTTHAIYLKAMYDNGIIEHGAVTIPEDYKEILEHLKAQETEFGNRFFRRIPVVRNENECQAAMQEFLAVAQDLDTVRGLIEIRNEGEFADLLPHDPTYRNINADCSWCNYKALCTAEMDGSNAELTKNLAYKQKEIKQNGSILR